MQADDIILVRTVINVGGVQCSNKHLLKVLAAPATDSVSATLLKYVDLWWDSVKDLISSSCELVCCDWNNLTRTEVAVNYPGNLGAHIGDFHPSISFLNIHIEGWDSLESAPRSAVGKTSQRLSGIAKDHTIRDRLINTELTTPWEVFMTTSHLLDVGEAHLVPQVSHDTAGKAWRDSGSPDPPGKPAPVYVYFDSQTAHADKIIRVSRARKPKGCF